MDLKACIREVPDFPKKGILFYDITTLLLDPRAMEAVTDQLAAVYAKQNIGKIVAIESRGFIFGAPLAERLGLGFVPVRKPGKLPADTLEVRYDLEYGSNTLCIHKDALAAGDRVVVVDDLLATDGTMAAAVSLVQQLGADVQGLAFVIELLFLKGRDKFKDLPIFSLIRYD